MGIVILSSFVIFFGFGAQLVKKQFVSPLLKFIILFNEELLIKFISFFIFNK